MTLKTKDISQSNKILEELAKLKDSVHYRTLRKLSVCCKWAVEQEKISKNPFLRVLKELKEPKPTDEAPDPFSRQAMERILDAYRCHSRCHHYADLIEFYWVRPPSDTLENPTTFCSIRVLGACKTGQ